MDHPTKIKFERCIRSLLVSNFEIRVNKYCGTIYIYPDLTRLARLCVRDGEHLRLKRFSRVAMALVHILQINFFSLDCAEIEQTRFQNDYQVPKIKKLDERNNQIDEIHPPSISKLYNIQT